MRVLCVLVLCREGADNRAARVFRNLRAGEIHAGDGVVGIRDLDGEPFRVRGARRVRDSDLYVDLVLDLMVEGNAFLQLQLAVDHFKSVIRDGIAVRVLCVLVLCREGADNRAARVFRNLRAREVHAGDRVVGIRDLDGESFRVRGARCVRDSDLYVDLVLDLVVEGNAVSQLQLAVDHLKPVIRDGIAVRVLCVFVLRREGADNRTARVFRNLRAGEVHASDRVVGIGDLDGEPFRVRGARRVRDSDLHVDLVLDLMVEGDAILQLQLAIDHLKPVIRDGIAVRVLCVFVLRREGADNRTARVFRNLRAGEVHASDRVVGIGDLDGEPFRVRGARRVRDSDLHVDLVLDLMVEGDAILQLQLAIDHLKPVIRDGIAVRVLCVFVLRREGADNRTARVFRNLRAREVHAGDGVVGIRDLDGECFDIFRALAVGDSDVDDDLIFDLVVEGDTVLQLQLAIDHLKPVVRDAITVRVSAIAVVCAQRSDDGAVVVFIQAVAGKIHVFRHIIRGWSVGCRIWSVTVTVTVTVTVCVAGSAYRRRLPCIGWRLRLGAICAGLWFGLLRFAWFRCLRCARLGGLRLCRSAGFCWLGSWIYRCGFPPGVSGRGAIGVWCFDTIQPWIAGGRWCRLRPIRCHLGRCVWSSAGRSKRHGILPTSGRGACAVRVGCIRGGGLLVVGRLTGLGEPAEFGT
ncbi:hypothetical protein NIT7645_03699 [Phaeobacter italicus]|nr:hypothetical protein NIT7645_03699 [Phaeobacter italicus]